MQPCLDDAHTRSLLLTGRQSWAAAGKNSNTSQFYITFAAAPQCDGKHVVIGQVVEGLDVLKQIGDAGCGLSHITDSARPHDLPHLAAEPCAEH